MTQDSKNQYLPTRSTPPQAGPDTQLLSQSEGPVGPPLPSLPSVGIHKEEHLLFHLTEVYKGTKNKNKCD